MLSHRPTSIEECDERLERVRQARRECTPAECELQRCYDDMEVELVACRVAMIPEPRDP